MLNGLGVYQSVRSHLKESNVLPDWYLLSKISTEYLKLDGECNIYWDTKEIGGTSYSTSAWSLGILMRSDMQWWSGSFA